MSQPLTPPTNHGMFLGATSYKHSIHEAQLRMAQMLPQVETLEDTGTSGLHPPQSSLLENEKLYDAAMRALRGVLERTLAHELL